MLEKAPSDLFLEIFLTANRGKTHFPLASIYLLANLVYPDSIKSNVSATKKQTVLVEFQGPF